jgi:hypothetical protein
MHLWAAVEDISICKAVVWPCCIAGSHAKHNEATGDNAGPIVLKCQGGEGQKNQEGKRTEGKKSEKNVEPILDDLKVWRLCPLPLMMHNGQCKWRL